MALLRFAIAAWRRRKLLRDLRAHGKARRAEGEALNHEAQDGRGGRSRREVIGEEGRQGDSNATCSSRASGCSSMLPGVRSALISPVTKDGRVGVSPWQGKGRIAGWRRGHLGTSGRASAPLPSLPGE